MKNFTFLDMTSTVLLFFIFCIIRSSVCYTEIDDETLQRDISNFILKKVDFSDNKRQGYRDELNDITPKNNSEYDFIIVGAGSAGATIASRLSEIENITILLIEAGAEETPLMDIPFLAPFLQLSNDINWGYKSESSSKYCKGFTDSKCNYPRGKVVGGSSITNYMVATRGNKYNYDEWANISDDKSWSYENMLHYFKKLEDFDVKEVKYNSKNHNKNGPVHISSAPYNTPLAKSFIKAGKELGSCEIDYNGESQIGYSYFQSTVFKGERWSTNRAYLHPAKNRSNLFLTKNSFVNTIIIDKDKMIANGVSFSKNGKEFLVKSKKEIILSAGAINSPQILMLSGIGPENDLKKLDIQVIKNAPVGKNLMDHVAYGGMIFETNITRDPIESNIFHPNNPAVHEYVTKRNGTLALGPGFEAVAFLDVDKLNATHGNPNIEIVFGLNAGLKEPFFQLFVDVSEENKRKINTEEISHIFWSAWPTITQPKSRGKLILSSKKPRDKPKLYLNFFNDPDDIRVLIKGIKEVIRISQTEEYKKYGSKMYKYPICEDKQYGSDDYWECAVRTLGMSLYHPSGTCKMGRDTDESAVVNSRLKVIGIERLRVADASIMPNIITGHTNIPTIAIAEKLSDMVKEDWGYSSIF